MARTRSLQPVLPAFLILEHMVSEIPCQGLVHTLRKRPVLPLAHILLQPCRRPHLYLRSATPRAAVLPACSKLRRCAPCHKRPISAHPIQRRHRYPRRC